MSLPMLISPPSLLPFLLSFSLASSSSFFISFSGNNFNYIDQHKLTLRQSLALLE